MRARIQKISKYAPSIFQGRIDFSASPNRSGRSFSLTLEHLSERLFARLFLGALAILSIAYVYFVSASIMNVIARKEALDESASLASAVSVLEREYFAALEGINPEDGARLGLTPVSTTVYVRRPGTEMAITHESNDI